MSTTVNMRFFCSHCGARHSISVMPGKCDDQNVVCDLCHYSTKVGIHLGKIQTTVCYSHTLAVSRLAHDARGSGSNCNFANVDD